MSSCPRVLRWLTDCPVPRTRHGASAEAPLAALPAAPDGTSLQGAVSAFTCLLLPGTVVTYRTFLPLLRCTRRPEHAACPVLAHPSLCEGMTSGRRPWACQRPMSSASLTS